MPVVHLSCSKNSARGTGVARRVRGLLYVGLLIAVAGCTGPSAGPGSGKGWEALTSELGEKAQAGAGSTSGKRAVNKTIRETSVATTASVSRSGAVRKAGSKVSGFAVPGDIRPDSVLGRTSASCRHLLALTGIETKLLRSPTVSAEGDDDGDMAVSIGYDVVDLRRARLKEELAVAKCRRHNVSAKLGSFLITSPQALSRAGYLAKANSLRASRGSFNAIRARIRRELNRGTLTYQRANLLKQHLQQIIARESKARGEAARREAVDDFQLQNAKGLDQSLIASERRIHHLNRKIRTADAVKLRLTGGYGVEESSTGVARSTNDEAYAKAKLSVRLGAFDPRRQELEDIAEEARIQGLYEEQSGVFWRAGEIASANRRALSALTRQRQEILEALAQTRRTAAIRDADYETELMMPRLRARIDVLALKAELAGLDATIADTRRIERTLSFR